MVSFAELSPAQVEHEPELAALAVLDSALMAARVALIAELPDAGHLGFHAPGPASPLLIVATLLVERTHELRALLTRYRHALDDFRAAEAFRREEFPF